MKRILIVDDDHDITLAFKRGLEGPEISVDVYNDPSLALSEFKPNTYHLLLLDVRMPKMNGFELYREVQKVDKSVKVCFITAFEVYYQALREVFPTLEIDCFIKKPIEMSELAKKVKLELNS